MGRAIDIPEGQSPYTDPRLLQGAGFAKLGQCHLGMTYKQDYTYLTQLTSISLPFEILGPVPRKVMVGAVGHFTLQPIRS